MEDDAIYYVTIYLRSGQSFTIDSTLVKTSRNRLTNDLVGVEWATPNDTNDRTYRRLPYVRLDDISAIVAVRGKPIE